MKINTDAKKIKALLTRGVENVYPTREFLEEKLKSGKPLRLYVGFDPTGPSLHLGHAISLKKLSDFQALGHKIIMLIGSFTAMIGDPTDKLATRKPLTREQVMKNCENYKQQASALIKFDGENPAELKYNNEWLDKLTLRDTIEVAANLTVPQLLERDMFQKRMQEGKTIGLHEFLYPLLQGFDSVAMDVDGELGGNDQTFNMLVGRDLMKAMKGKEKFVLTNKLLTDPSGQKMGKSEGNMITLDDLAEEMFGKVMSWTDGMIEPGFELCTLEEMEKVDEVAERLKKGENPRDLKMELAVAIVKIYHGEAAAEAARDNFIKTFSKKEMPDEMPEVKAAGLTVADALVAAGFVKSKGEARRNVEQGGVKVNEKVVHDAQVKVNAGDVVQKGKRFFVKIKQ